MKKLLALVAIGVIGWQAYTHQYARTLSAASDEAPVAAQTKSLADRLSLPARPSQAYSCDGRTYCSQMTSCDEAKFFLANCPGTKMDGDGDGIPCERQWCGEH